ncbi:hypothetical protein N9C34_02625 [Candidatus Marinimicrobia bacterium]|nr:hypothetical protein [Candidatus Neomarinimicrobiota bacterium]
MSKKRDKLWPKVNDYIYKEIIFKNERMGTTKTIYRSTMYIVFSDYSREDVDYCLKLFYDVFSSSNENYPIHGVKKIIIKDKKRSGGQGCLIPIIAILSSVMSFIYFFVVLG